MRWHSSVGTQRYPLRMAPCRVAFDLTEQLVVSTHQPSLTTCFLGGGLVVRTLLDWLNNQAFTAAPDGESSPIDNTVCKTSSRFT